MNLKYILKQLSLCFVVGSCLTVCNPTSSGNKGKATNEPPRDPTQTTGDEQECSRDSVIEILKGASRAISFSHRDTRTLLAWDLISRKGTDSIFFPMSYHEISADGQYLLRKISNRKYQVVAFSSRLGYESELININSVGKPEVKFSKNSKYLVIKNNPHYSRNFDHVSIYDIESKKYLYSVDFTNILHFDLSYDGQYFVIGREEGFKKNVYVVESLTQKVVWQESLPIFQTFREMIVAEDVVIIETGHNYRVFDIQNGNRLSYLKNGELQGISNNGKYALVAHGPFEVSIIDLQNGNEVYKKPVPQEILLSSCRLDDSTMIVYCKSKNLYYDVIRWDLAAGVLTSSCKFES